MFIKVKGNSLFIVDGIRVPINRLLYIRRPTPDNKIKVESHYFDLIETIGDTILVGFRKDGTEHMFPLSSVYDTESDAYVLKAVGYARE